jgi:hypothetical protein
MATRIDWDELFPPLPEPGRRRIDLSGMPGARTRGEATRIDLGNVGDINQSNAVNHAAKGDMPADIVAELLAGQSDEEQALRELSPIDALARSLETPPRMENYQRGQNSLRTAEDILSMIPGPGNVIAARDAFQGAEDAGKAFGAGDTRGGLLNAALAALSGVGAVVGLPTSRMARDAAREGSRTARIFAGPEAKTADRGALDRAKDMRARGADRDEIWRGMSVACPISRSTTARPRCAIGASRSRNISTTSSTIRPCSKRRLRSRRSDSPKPAGLAAERISSRTCSIRMAASMWGPVRRLGAFPWRCMKVSMRPTSSAGQAMGRTPHVLRRKRWTKRARP